MNVLVLFVTVLASLHLVSAASKGKVHLALEQALQHNLHKPWPTSDRPPEQPRKGEYKCKAGVCRLSFPDASDLQAPVQLDVNWEYIKQ